jgi:hypothetical protein
LELTPGSIVRSAVESISGEQPFSAKEGAQIKESKCDISNNDRFFNEENTRALATAKIGPKKRWQAAVSCWLSEARAMPRCGWFFLFQEACKTQKKCYNKILDSASNLAAYGGRADSNPNILLLDVFRRIFTGGVRG